MREIEREREREGERGSDGYCLKGVNSEGEERGREKGGEGRSKRVRRKRDGHMIC